MTLFGGELPLIRSCMEEVQSSSVGPGVLIGRSLAVKIMLTLGVEAAIRSCQQVLKRPQLEPDLAAP